MNFNTIVKTKITQIDMIIVVCENKYNDMNK